MASDHRGQPLHAGKRTADEQHEQMTAEQKYHENRAATDALLGYTPTSDPKSLSQLVGGIQRQVSTRDYQPKLASGTHVFPLHSDTPGNEPFQV